jgi:hypothetical protein
VRVRLAAAKIGEKRGQNLVVQPLTLDRDAKTLVFEFPAHSHTPHETTLMSVVRACVDLNKDPHEWHLARGEAIFSVPRTGEREPGQSSVWDRCAILSLTWPKGE